LDFRRRSPSQDESAPVIGLSHHANSGGGAVSAQETTSRAPAGSIESIDPHAAQIPARRCISAACSPALNTSMFPISPIGGASATPVSPSGPESRGLRRKPTCSGGRWLRVLGKMSYSCWGLTHGNHQALNQGPNLLPKELRSARPWVPGASSPSKLLPKEFCSGRLGGLLRPRSAKCSVCASGLAGLPCRISKSKRPWLVPQSESMNAVETNTAVRLLVADDRAQFELAGLCRIHESIWPPKRRGRRLRRHP